MALFRMHTKRTRSWCSRRFQTCRMQTTQRIRSWSLTEPATLTNEQAVAALPSIQHILDARRLTRCNEYVIFKPGLVTNKKREGENTLRSQACIHSALISLYFCQIIITQRHTIPLQTLLLFAKSSVSSCTSS